MKRTLAVVLVLCLILSGCAVAKPEATQPSTQPGTTTPSTPPTTQGTEPSQTEATEPSQTEATESSQTEATEPSQTEATEPSQTDATEPSQTEATEPSQTEATEPSQTEATEPSKAPSLLDNAQAIGSNLYYIPNSEIEETPTEEMRLWNGNLLLWSFAMGDNGYNAVFKLISPEDGSLLREATLPSSGFLTVQVSGSKLGICDSGKGAVYILDSTLAETQHYTLAPDSNNWYLSSNLQTLYQIDWEKGVTARDLATGTVTEILSNATEIYTRNQTGSYLLLSYTDLSSQRITCRLLNLQTGLLERLPVDTDVSSAVCGDNVWLLGDSSQWGTYYLIVDGQRKTATWTDNRMDLLLPRCHLVTLDGNSQGLTLYTTDGSFVSRCSIPDERAMYFGSSVVWSDTWDGYFLLGVGHDRSRKLLFWDVDAPVSGEDLPLQEEKEQGGVTADPALYARAKDIGDRYGVTIRIADQCALTYNLFAAYEVSTTAYIMYALDVMEQALAQYPAGYFEQLKFGNIQSIYFDLIGGLHPSDNSVYGGTYAGITLEQPGCYTVALDVYTLTENNVYHEVTHMTDGKLSWDAKLRGDALFSEEAWNKLLPEGFAYAYTYQDLTGSSIWDYVNSGYFVNDYACRYPTEDRATMVEMAMMGNDSIYAANPYLGAKLDYYSRCIRDCFNTDGWPEVTAWEKILKK